MPTIYQMNLVLASRQVAGGLFVAAAAEFFFGMLFSEALYPGYSISSDTISHLGSIVCSAGVCHFQQPSADIFNSSVILLGLLILVASLLGLKEKRAIQVSVIITGLGAIGVGLTLALHSSPLLHSLVSLVTFVAAGISAVLSYSVLSKYLSIISVVLGAASLLATILFSVGIYAGLGIGGMERLIVYPVLIWGTVFGASLSSSNQAS
jgi:hypothetical membrane protein